MCGGSSKLAQPSVVVKTVAVTGLPTVLTVGQAAQLAATATLSDNSTRVVTVEAAWLSVNALVATVSPTGLVTAIGVGVADIRASYQGITGNQTAGVLADDGPGLACGVERWPVKTLSDASASQINLDSVETTTIRDLNLLPTHCSGLPDARTFAPEFQVFEVMGQITVVRAEEDRDYHIAIADLNNPVYTIVTEIADTACEGAIRSPFRQVLAQTRGAFDGIRGGNSLSSLVGSIVRIRGVGFYDFAHGQTGRSQNCLELHPIVSIQRVE